MPTSALVVSVESVNGPISRYYAKYLSTERTWSGWLAVEAVCREPVSGVEIPS
jgi:hypothetical protein